MNDCLYVKIKIFQKTKNGEKLYKKIYQKFDLENFSENADFRVFFDEIFTFAGKFYNNKNFRIVLTGGFYKTQLFAESFFEEK